MMKVIVFDLGGTLMEFRGMPSNWNEYYITAFRKVDQTLNLKLSEHELEESAKILRSYNPRITKRENEIMPEIIFSDAISNWANKPNINEVIKIFFEEVIRNAHIYDYSIRLLKKCKEAGYKIACLTDLPNGMPDKIFKTAVQEIIECLDLYVSSQSCGVRKPNQGGLCKIARIFDVSKSEIMFVGDEEKDYITAQNMGCDFVYIKDFLKQITIWTKSEG